MSDHKLAEVAAFTVQVNRPIEAVFTYLANMENFGQWFPAVLGIESGSDLAHGLVGKKYLEHVEIPLRGIQHISLLVVEANAPTRFVTEGEFAPLFPRMSIDLQAKTNDQTEVAWRMQSRNSSRLFRATILPVVRMIMGRRAAQASRTLVQNLA